jgi:DNA polymerase/3'-5' exonuclease PolX
VSKVAISNQEIAETLDQVADLLETEGANTFRVQSSVRASL